MKKVIIGIHGLGNKPPKYLLKKWWKDSMIEGFKKQGRKNLLPEFDMVYWADILYEKPLDKWERNIESPFFMDEPYKKSPKQFEYSSSLLRKKLIDFLSSQLNKIFLNDDKTLNYSFITDYIIHKYFKDLNIYYTEECLDENDELCKAKELIRKRFLETLNKYKDYEILIVAHSMGSIIAFDVLTFFTPQANINTLVTIGSPLGLPVVVSKIASEYKKQGINENAMNTPNCVTKNWFNLADINDKIAFKYKLHDDFTANENGIAPVDYLVVNDYMINNKSNPHKSFGYLRTPEMAKIITDFMESDGFSLKEKAKNRLDRWLNKIAEQRAYIKDRLNID